MMNPLQALHDLGESIWLDNIRRRLLDDRQLESYLGTYALTGLTSNPTIFEHAIAGSDDYDTSIRSHLGKNGLNSEAIFFELALEDLTRAAELFRPTYEKTGARDGFVSLELSPELADDMDGSVAQARKLYARARRENLLIKVPGTPAGARITEQLIYEGIPVNVTLLFSPEQYQAAAEAYLRGIERRLMDGLPLQVPSVASLFVSRWDKASAEILPGHLKNRLGLAIGRQTYRAYRRVLASERWKKLANNGALPQRLLWASTGVKDPDLPVGYYISGLTAPDTINTIPESTLLTFAKEGMPGSPLPEDGGNADDIIQAIEKAGINTRQLARELQEEGKKKFSESYHKLLARIENRLTELGEIDARERNRLGMLGSGISDTIRELSRLKAMERMWQRDYSLWKPDPTEISDRLGWLDSPQEMLAEISPLKQFVEELHRDGITHVLWSGMGGSSLFPQVLNQTFRGSSGLKMLVLDSSNPVTIRQAAASLPLGQTLFLFASKSGGTLETRCHLDYFWSLNSDSNHYAAITDEGSELGKIGKERGFRRVFFNNPDIGGRYSALSHFGLVAAALLAVDMAELLNRAKRMITACMPDVKPENNPGLYLGAAIGYAALHGRDKLTLVMPPEIRAFGTWLEQLIAESTGKEGVGILPVVDEPLGKPEVYAADRFFICLGEDSGNGRLAALAEAGHPVLYLPYMDRYSIGAECLRWEFAIAMAGKVLNINPFNQPNVEAAKKAAARVLAEGIPKLPITSAAEAFQALHPGDYLAIQAYVATESERFTELGLVRENLRNRFRVATTLGLGPRYLHSTGQLHKGGSSNGVFIQLIEDLAPDLKIPGRDYSFKQLFAAQAAGDYMALKEYDRRIFRVDFTDFLLFASEKDS